MVWQESYYNFGGKMWGVQMCEFQITDVQMIFCLNRDFGN